MVEGGGTLIWTLFEQGLVDELQAFVGSIVIGGKDAPPTPADGTGFLREEDFPRLRIIEPSGSTTACSYGGAWREHEVGRTRPVTGSTTGGGAKRDGYPDGSAPARSIRKKFVSVRVLPQSGL